MENFSKTYCDICHGKGINSTVQTICKECREFYCKNCSVSHSLQKISKHHTMFDLLSTYCDICHGKGIQSNVRTICKECREFYCQNCSISHTLQKVAKGHTMIDLDPQRGNIKTAETRKSELSPDFLQYLTVRENTGIYRAQVAMNDGACEEEHGEEVKRLSDKSIPPTVHNADKVGEFNVARPDDKVKVRITGVLTLADKVIVADPYNWKLKLYDQKGNFLSSIDTNTTHMHRAWGLTSIGRSRFASCDYSDKGKVCLWTLHGATIECQDTAYDVDDKSHGIQYDGLFYAVLHGDDNAITVLDKQGRKLRKITHENAFGDENAITVQDKLGRDVRKKTFRKNIQFGYDIHMDSESHNIYVPCVYDNPGVLCVSKEGAPIWFYPLTGLPTGITENKGVLYVADHSDGCVHMMTKMGEYKGKLLINSVDRSSIDRPSGIFYDSSAQKLYVSFHEKDIVRVFNVET